MATRIETDSMGEVELPADAHYGPQTQRAVNNFTIDKQPMPYLFITTLIHIKKIAALTNLQLGILPEQLGKRIIESCDQLLSGDFADQFPVPIFQTGSGTSSNMNVNEVIANLASDKEIIVNPNDHVNLGQSSNDVIPTTLYVSTSMAIVRSLLPALSELTAVIREKGSEYKEVIKTGRTHLMDALPIRLEKEFECWAVTLDESKERLSEGITRLSRLPLGGTAVGSGVNCHPEFPQRAINLMSNEFGIDFQASVSRYKGLSSLDTPLEISSHLKTLGMSLFKIANDLRWMNSGPLSGLGEISLPSLQPGSSIMPAKVNPVIPEAVCMASAQVAGYDTANGLASQSGNFQLNTMFPLVAANLLHAVELITGSCDALSRSCFRHLVVNKDVCTAALEMNPILVTALAPETGYLQAAALAKQAVKEQRSIFEVAKAETDIPEERLKQLLNPTKLADGG